MTLSPAQSINRIQLAPTIFKKSKQVPSVVICTPKDALNDELGSASKNRRTFGGLVRALSRSPLGEGALAESCNTPPRSAQTDEERGEDG